MLVKVIYIFNLIFVKIFMFIFIELGKKVIEEFI